MLKMSTEIACLQTIGNSLASNFVWVGCNVQLCSLSGVYNAHAMLSLRYTYLKYEYKPQNLEYDVENSLFLN